MSAKPSTWPAGSAAASRPAACHQRSVAGEGLIWPAAMAQPQLVRLLAVPRRGAGTAVDLVLQRVLVAGADLATRPSCRARRCRSAAGSWPHPRSGSRARPFSPNAPGRELSTGPSGMWRFLMNVAMSAMTSVTCRPVTNDVRSSQCEPISPTARSLPPTLRFETPVPVGVEHQPVLEVTARDQSHVAECTRRPRRRGDAG